MVMVTMSALSLLLAAPAPDEFVRAYSEAIQSYDPIHLELSFREVCEAPTKLNGVAIREGSYVVRRDGKRWKIDAKGLSRGFNDEGRLHEVRTDHEWVVNESFGEVLVQVDVASKKLDYVDFRREPRPERETVATADSFMMLFGFNYGDGKLPLVDVFRESKLEAREEMLKGKPALRLDSIGRFGRATVWFDPQAGMQVCRLVKLKSGEDLLYDNKVSSIPVVPADRFSPGGKVITIETALDVTKFAKSGDKYFPQDAVITAVSNYADGRKAGTRYTLHVDSVRLGAIPASEFNVTTPIPDGFAVQVTDQPNIEYEWRGGRIQKSISAEARANLRAARFGSTFSIAGYFFGFAALLLLTAVLATWLYQRAGTNT